MSFRYCLVLLLVLTGCVFVRPWRPGDAIQFERMKHVRILDDGEADSLRLALKESISFFAARPRSFTLGERELSSQEMVVALGALEARLGVGGLSSEFLSWMEEHFDAYEVKRARPLVTGYFLPLLKGSRVRDERFRYPLYRPPPEMVTIKLAKFFPPELLTALRPVLKGQLLNGGEVAPYFSRNEIDRQGKLAGRGLELFWVEDEVEAFFLHIQGSGVIELPDGSRVIAGYADKNGQSYVAIGKTLVEEGVLPRGGASMQSIKAYLRENPGRMAAILDRNPSYVFFREVSGAPVGNLGRPVTPLRSVATDQAVYPPGMPMLLESDLPATPLPAGMLSSKRTRRIVFNHDTGGAIRGAARVDFFTGFGEEAALLAGALQHEGRIRVLVPRKAP